MLDDRRSGWSREQRLSRRAARRSRRWNATDPVIRRGLALTPVKFGISFTVHRFQPGRRAGARLHRRLGAAESRRHGDGPGAVHQGGAGRRRRARAAAVGDPGVGHRHGQGAQHLGDRGLRQLRSERQGGAGRGADHSRAAGAICLRALHGVDAAAGPLSRRPRAASASAASTFARAACSRPTGRACRCRPPASTARPKIHWDKATHARAAVLLFRVWRGGQRSGRRHADRRNAAAARRHPARRRARRSIRPSTWGRSKAASCRAWAGSPREELWWNAHGELRTHAPSTYKIPTARDWPAQAHGPACSRRSPIARTRSIAPRRSASRR